METEATQPTKQERSRTRWTASLDTIFADLVVKQIQLGNRPNNVFDKKTWNHIRDEFNKQTDRSILMPCWGIISVILSLRPTSSIR